jgi:hypothetical protein
VFQEAICAQEPTAQNWIVRLQLANELVQTDKDEKVNVISSGLPTIHFFTSEDQRGYYATFSCHSSCYQ